MTTFAEIHCHLLPGIDDGPKSVEEALAMAQLAADDGVDTIVATPHQLGAFANNDGQTIRQLAAEMQDTLRRHDVPIAVLPGAEIRVGPELVLKLLAGEVLSLGDHGKHVLLEMPHQKCVPIGPLLAELRRHGYTAILAHPERNGGILSQPHHWKSLVAEGCLMQVTASSLLGAFGAASQGLAELMIRRGLVHFLSSDGHNAHSRRPVLGLAYERACELAGEAAATAWCSRNPSLVAAGEDVLPGAVAVVRPRRRWWSLATKAN
jgi:protein-tyrosine phosphatase